MTEKLNILRGIVCDGDSIIEACENADTDKLREEGDGELADVIEKMLSSVDLFSPLVGLHDEELVDRLIVRHVRLDMIHDEDLSASIKGGCR